MNKKIETLEACPKTFTEGDMFVFFHWLIDNSIGHLFRDTYYYYGKEEDKPSFIIEPTKHITKVNLWQAYLHHKT